MNDDEFGPRFNYFNYFTEVEEHFRQARGTGLFFISPLDWALIETWKNSGIPLEAVLRGIDAAFEKWRSGRKRTQLVNSLTYCAQAVAEQAKQAADVSAPAASSHREEAPFTVDELRNHLVKNAADLEKAGLSEIASKLQTLATEAETHHRDLESLERTLTAYEDKMLALQRSRLTEDELIAGRAELDAELRPYRRKLTADQLTMLEKQFLDRRILERANLPRLSLFYLR